MMWIYGQSRLFEAFVRKTRSETPEFFTDKQLFLTILSVIAIFGTVHLRTKRPFSSMCQSSPNLCVKYFSQAQVVQGMRMHPCLSTITLEGAVKGAPSAHLEEVPLTASERVIHLTQLLVFVVPLPILLVQQPS